MKKILISILVLMATLQSSQAIDSFLPSAIYQLDKRFTHHVVVVEKSTHSLYLYKFGEKTPELIKKYTILTGKFTGNKFIEGDKKTPEGIYFFQKFYNVNYLLNRYGDYGKIYGAGAFTSNYPNPIDRRSGKTGGGIWLHSTDDDNRIKLGLDSKGCVVATEKDLKEISKYIDLANTPMIIVENLNFQNLVSWQTAKNSITKVVTDWSKAWIEKDFNTYINSYSKNGFIHPVRGRFNAFRTYKKAVFSRNDKPSITFSDVSILHNNDYVVVTMVQDYNSALIQDMGKKVLYLRKNANYQWKIVAEEWSRLEEEDRTIAFVPKMRYFGEQLTKKDTDNDSGSI